MPKEYRTVHRRLGPLVFCIDIRTVRQQQPSDIHESTHGRVVQRRRLVVIDVAGVRPGAKQQHGNLKVAVLGGVVERGFTRPVINLIHTRPGGEMRLHGGHVVAPTCRRPERQLRRSLGGGNPPERQAE